MPRVATTYLLALLGTVACENTSPGPGGSPGSLALVTTAHQGQEGFRVWVVEQDGVVQEQYIVSLVDSVRAE